MSLYSLHSSVDRHGSRNRPPTPTHTPTGRRLDPEQEVDDGQMEHHPGPHKASSKTGAALLERKNELAVVSALKTSYGASYLSV